MSARLSLVPKPAWQRVPSIYALEHMPIARSSEFELSDRETAQTRRLIYSINKQGRFRYRTMRDGTLLQVWRIK
jgi:hypothetical protein